MPVRAFKDYYQILGVSGTANTADIKRAFRRLARIYHPDINPGVRASERFQEIKEAYDVLNNPDRRKQYDLLIHLERDQVSVDQPNYSEANDQPNHDEVGDQSDFYGLGQWLPLAQTIAEVEIFMRSHERFLPLKLILCTWVLVGLPAIALSIWQFLLHPSPARIEHPPPKQSLEVTGLDRVGVNPLPQITQFYSPKFVYTQQAVDRAVVDSPPDPTAAEMPPKATIILNWEITHPDQVKELHVIDMVPDITSSNPVQHFTFENGKLPKALTPFCRLQKTLICRNVPTQPRRPGFYTFQLIVLPKHEQQVPHPSEITETIEVTSQLLFQVPTSNSPAPRQ